MESATTADSQILPPGFLLDHYRVESVLGVGGFGVTYRCHDERLERTVAIKEFLPAEFALRDEGSKTVKPRSGRDGDYRYGLERFLQEAKALAKFHHANIVSVIGFLEANGTAYLVMEYVEGRSLSQYLKAQGGTLAEARLREIAIPVLRGLVAVHAAGFLHRDIKPGNIYLRDGGEPLLIDFGAARQALGEHSRSVTGIVSAGYAPPEQYTTDATKQGPWTDLYAFGATLYRCISGKDPVDSPTRQSAQVEGEPDPLAPAIELGRGRCAEPLLALIDALLALPLKRRPQSAQAVLEALQSGAQIGNPMASPEEPRSTTVTERIAEPFASPAEARPARGDPPPASHDRRGPGPLLQQPEPKVPAPVGAGPARDIQRSRTASWIIRAALLAAALAGLGWWTSQKPAPTAPPAATTHAPPAVAPVPVTTSSAATPNKPTKAELLSGRGIVEIDTEPSGATVTLDGVELGTTPYLATSVRAGTYTLRLTHPERIARQESLTVTDHRVLKSRYSLDPAYGQLSLLSTPSSAWIELDGKRLAEVTPATLEKLTAGTHRLRLGVERYTPLERELHVAADQTAREEFTLTPIRYGTLTLTVVPANASVTLKGVGEKYRAGMKLPAGRYDAEITAPGYDTWKGSIDVASDQASKQRITLELDATTRVARDEERQKASSQLAGKRAELSRLEVQTKALAEQCLAATQEHNSLESARHKKQLECQASTTQDFYKKNQRALQRCNSTDPKSQNAEARIKCMELQAEHNAVGLRECLAAFPYHKFTSQACVDRQQTQARAGQVEREISALETQLKDLAQK